MFVEVGKKKKKKSIKYCGNSEIYEMQANQPNWYRWNTHSKSVTNYLMRILFPKWMNAIQPNALTDFEKQKNSESNKNPIG